MPESEWITVLKVLVGGGLLAIVGGGTRVWFTAWQASKAAKAKAIEDDKAREEKRRQDELDRMRDELREARALVEKGQARFESLLMDAAAKGQDDKREKAELIAILAKLNELSFALIKATEEATRARAKDAP